MDEQERKTTDAEKVKLVQQKCLNYLHYHADADVPEAFNLCYSMLHLTLDCSKVKYPPDGGMPTYYDMDGNEIDLEKLRIELNARG